MSKLLWRSVCFTVLLLLSSGVRANAIFDVVVSYGPPDIVYSFSMEFVDAVGFKTEQDLVGGDVTNERLFIGGVAATLVNDGATVSILFDLDAQIFFFHSVDKFVLADVGSCNAFLSSQALCKMTSRLEAGVDEISVTVAARGVEVTEPASIALLLLGLSVMLFAGRRQNRKSLLTPLSVA